MKKFRNKRTGAIVEVELLYYVMKYANDPQYEEIVEVKETTKEEKTEDKKEVARKSLLR